MGATLLDRRADSRCYSAERQRACKLKFNQMCIIATKDVMSLELRNETSMICAEIIILCPNSVTSIQGRP